MKTKVASVFVGLLVVMATHLGARAETQQPRAKSVKKDLTAVEHDPNDTKVFPLYSWNQRLPGTKRFELVFNGSGVLDRETGLVWQRYIGGSHDGLNWQGALQYCWQAQSGKRMGWRLPTAEEFTSLLEVGGRTGREPRLPAGHPFKSDKGQNFRGGGGFWSSSRFLTPHESSVREIVMQCGTYDGCNGFPFSTASTMKGSVWCVRGNNNSN